MRTCELNYPGNIDPNPNVVMGPDLAGRCYRPVGAIYDPETDKTTVTVEQVPDDVMLELAHRAGLR